MAFNILLGKLREGRALASISNVFKKILIFTEPNKQEQFTLRAPDDSGTDGSSSDMRTQDSKANDKQDIKQDSKQDRIEREIETKNDEAKKKPETSDKISDDIDVSLAFMKKIYSIPVNCDIIVREFSIRYENELARAFIMFFDGMTDREIINNYILKPLMVDSIKELHNNAEDLHEFISNQLLPHNQVKIEKSYSKAIEEINFGGCALFVEGLTVAFTADVKGWEHRGVEKPANEIVIRGPQEAFNEILRTNSSQIRKRLKNENLIVDDVVVGKVSKTPCSILYIKDVANESLIDEVKRRLESIHVDYMLDSGILEQLIEDSTIFPSPQMISTERPDYVAELLVTGKVAIIVNGSPNVLVVPTTVFDFMHSAEDIYIRFPYVNLLRFVRYMALFLALLLPAIYVAINNYHVEMIPTDLLLAIEANREKVPFPSIVEIILMELSFELIREAGVRVPGPIGPTLGIIGALILGQAAVAANIVSPILIIIVAVTGIGSFALPNYSLAYSIRIMRFAFIFLGGIAGFLGITLGLFLIGVWSTSLKSFGVPFAAPLGPRTIRSDRNVLFRAPEWKLEYRPDYLNVKKKKKQDKISMGWKADYRKK